MAARNYEWKRFNTEIYWRGDLWNLALYGEWIKNLKIYVRSWNGVNAVITLWWMMYDDDDDDDNDDDGDDDDNGD